MPKVHQEDEWDDPRIDSFQNISSFLLSETLISLVQNMVIISLISDVMGVIDLHIVGSFSRLLPSPPEINWFLVLYTLFLLTPITLDSTLMF